MGVHCGVDIIEISRVRNSLETLGRAFRDRVFTPGEVEYCENRKEARYLSYAARFAAKEAVAKALGTGIGNGVGWKDIEVLCDEKNKPYAVLKGKALERFREMGGKDLAISLSHGESFAVACAVLESEP